MKKIVLFLSLFVGLVVLSNAQSGATIVTQPLSQTVCDGATVTLSITATGVSTIFYRWQSFDPIKGVFNDIASPSSFYSGVTTPALSFNTTGNVGAGTYRCRTLIDFNVFSNNAAISINALPTAPTSTGNSACGSASLTLSAFGGKGGQYRWYTQSSGGIAISGEVNGSYSTPSITSTTTYYVSINNGLCESLRTPVIATINTIPTAPTATGNSACGAAVITLNASGGSNGQYRWYTAATGGTPIAGEVNSSYVTPSLISTTTYYVAISTIACESTRTAVVATINTIPAAPSVTGNSGCGTSTVALNASGGTNGQYRWYTTATGGTAITGEVNSSYTTPSLTNTTTYYVSINSGTCEGARTSATATIKALPASPSATGQLFCSGFTATLKASGGTNGQYKWYTTATGVAAITGEVNSSYTTPTLAATTTYYVTVTSGGCESLRTSVTATLNTGCVPPTIATKPLAIPIGGKISLDLVPLIKTANNNLDTASIAILILPSSGGKASISSKGVLTIDYNGLNFSGTENITIKACDLNNNCAQQKFSIDVAGAVVVYNAVSVNGDGKNDFFRLQYIEALSPKNQVMIYNRWGDEVFSISDYDNSSTRKFTGFTNDGSKLPVGTYFYKVNLLAMGKTLTGYLEVKY
jgi:gliding motility-associated-like protein